MDYLKKNNIEEVEFQGHVLDGEGEFLMFLGKAPALALREKLLLVLINAVYLSLSSHKIRIQNFPASRMLSRTSVLLRFVSAEIHLPF